MIKCCIDRLPPGGQSNFHMAASYFLAADAAGLIEKFWPNGKLLRLYFIDGTEEEKKYILDVASEWSKYANIRFERVNEWHAGSSDIRISMDPRLGSWSYIGRDCESIVWADPTMNLGWLDRDTILHEFGHALGLLHEHQNPVDAGFQFHKENVSRDLSGPPNNWDQERINWNMFYLHSVDLVRGTKLDLDSIMLYAFPQHWTLDGKGSRKNTELSSTDKKFIGEVYSFEKKVEHEDSGFEVVDLFKDMYQVHLDLPIRKHPLAVVAGRLGIDTGRMTVWRLKNAIWEVLNAYP